MFSPGEQLHGFHREAKLFELNILIKKPFVLGGQTILANIIHTAIKFTQFPALNETPEITVKKP